MGVFVQQKTYLITIMRCQSLGGHKYIKVIVDLPFRETKFGIFVLWKSRFQISFQIFPFEFVARKSLLCEPALSCWRRRNPFYPLLHKACDGS